MENFEQLINNSDLKLFENIKSQLLDEDKQSLLACQLATRQLLPTYNYLEIGSYLGGSIQPYLLDDKCAKIYSVDNRLRNLAKPDERGVDRIYMNNSTERMLNLLKEIAPTKVDKITAIDGDTQSLKTSEIKDKIDICFIDGEHTNSAVLSDFKFCLNTIQPNALIMFHDTNIIYQGIADCIQYLKDNAIQFRAYSLPMLVFAIEIRNFPVHQSPHISECLLNNYNGFLYVLQSNDFYRKFYNTPLFSIYHRLKAKLKGSNISNDK